MRGTLIKSVTIATIGFLSTYTYGYNIRQEDTHLAINMLSTCGTETSCLSEKPITAYGVFILDIHNNKNQNVTYDIYEYLCFGRTLNGTNPCDSRKKSITLEPGSIFNSTEKLTYTNSFNVDHYSTRGNPMIVSASYGYYITEKYGIGDLHANKTTEEHKTLPMLVKK